MRLLSLSLGFIVFFAGFTANAFVPKKIILLIGDGMGLSQVSYEVTNDKNNSNFEKFKTISLVKTSSLSGEVTDSAAAATAMASGQKTFNHVVGLNQNKKPVKTILDIAKENGLSTGIIVTSSLVDATPAAFFAHQESREMYKEIAQDFLQSDVDVAIGGGLQYFDDDLQKKIKEKNYKIFTDKKDFEQNAITQKTLALLALNHMPKMSQGRGEYLKNSFKKSLNFLNQNKKGFFLMIEASQIDFAGHENDAQYLLNEMQDFNQVIGEALDFASKNKDVLVVVTADHETGGFAMITKNKIQKGNRIEPDLRFISFGHSATMVPLFAYGDGARNFAGVYENTQVFEKLLSFIKR